MEPPSKTPQRLKWRVSILDSSMKTDRRDRLRLGPSLDLDLLFKIFWILLCIGGVSVVAYFYYISAEESSVCGKRCGLIKSKIIEDVCHCKTPTGWQIVE